jgi:transcriptional regulator of acetoin/glycerol metabolism
VLLCDDAITPDHLPAGRSAAAEAAPQGRPADPGVHDERARIIAALEACAGNQSRAARMLGIPRRTFLNRLDAHGIPRPRKLASEEPDES